MIGQLQFGHVIDCKIIIRENIEPPRELICRKALRFAAVHGVCLRGALDPRPVPVLAS
ncbi:protein of unknown function [Pseudomonas inefficax]|uniref:Uncharacterized protein n=2 Tax=Pseudomonas TaxID=286 RepID=A0AAQ1P4M2_9PSED|nr:protein of unknown function [Pseudomonas inefficax]